MTAAATEHGRVWSVGLLAASALAVLGLAGSLHLSLGMNLRACPLCFYQRTFMMSLVAVLGMGLLGGLGRSGRLALLALPLAVAGLGVAGFHLYLEAVGKLECPKGLAGWGTAPLQSLVMFVGVVLFLLLDVVASRHGGWFRWPLLLVGTVLGAALAVASSTSNPPPPPPPDKPYAGPPDICRPPYVEK